MSSPSTSGGGVMVGVGGGAHAVNIITWSVGYQGYVRNIPWQGG